VSPDGSGHTARVEQQGEEVHLSERRCSGCQPGVVDEHGEGDTFLSNERLGVAPVAGADGNHLGALASDLSVVLTQLRGMLAAEQSPKVPKEHEDHRSLSPIVAEPMHFSIGSLQLDLFKAS
jgi:hypothetical protein